MSLHPCRITPVPLATSQVAQAAFPKGNLYLLNFCGLKQRKIVKVSQSDKESYTFKAFYQAKIRCDCLEVYFGFETEDIAKVVTQVN